MLFSFSRSLVPWYFLPPVACSSLVCSSVSGVPRWGSGGRLGASPFLQGAPGPPVSPRLAPNAPQRTVIPSMGSACAPPLEPRPRPWVIGTGTCSLHVSSPTGFRPPGPSDTPAACSGHFFPLGLLVPRRNRAVSCTRHTTSAHGPRLGSLARPCTWR